MAKKLVKKKNEEPEVDEHPTREGQTGGSKPKEKPKGKGPSSTPGDDLSD